MERKKSNGRPKNLVFTINLTIALEELADFSEGLDKLREFGKAEITDVQVIR